MKKFFSGVWNVVKAGALIIGNMFVLTTRYATEAVRDHFRIVLDWTYSVGRSISRGWNSSKLLTILGMVFGLPGLVILWAIFPIAAVFYFTLAWIVAPVIVLLVVAIIAVLALTIAIPFLLVVYGKWIMTLKDEKAKKTNTSSEPQASETSEAVEAEVVDTEE